VDYELLWNTSNNFGIIKEENKSKKKETKTGYSLSTHLPMTDVSRGGTSGAPVPMDGVTGGTTNYSTKTTKVKEEIGEYVST
jgi:hypothetical protein